MWAYSQMDGCSSTEVITEKADQIDPPFCLGFFNVTSRLQFIMG
ncbi:MAG: hypothetical protein H6Q26_2808 [Bacteroidetes bacterium]|nr:hypothetical protein [Bacteroidota bacterium]